MIHLGVRSLPRAVEIAPTREGTGARHRERRLPTQLATARAPFGVGPSSGHPLSYPAKAPPRDEVDARPRGVDRIGRLFSDASMTTHSVSVLSAASELDALMPEWERLFYSAGSANVFAHPRWLLTWAKHYVRPHDILIVTARTGPDLVGWHRSGARA